MAEFGEFVRMVSELEKSNLLKKPHYLDKPIHFMEPSIVLSGPSDKSRMVGGNMPNTEMLITPQSLDKDDNDDDDSDMGNDCIDQLSSSGAGNSANNVNNNTSNKSMTKMCDKMVQTLVTYGLRQVNTPEENFMKNPDLAFFMSILPEVRMLTPKQKEKFRREVVKASDYILYGQDL